MKSKAVEERVGEGTWASLAYLWRKLWAQGWRFRLAFFLLFLTAVLALGFPYIAGEIVGDAMRFARAAWRASDAVTGEEFKLDAENMAVLKSLNKSALILMVILALQAFLAFWRIRWLNIAVESALISVRKDAFANIIRQDLSFFAGRKAGEMVSALTADLALIAEGARLSLPQAVRYLVIISGGMFFLCSASWRLFIFLMLLILPLILLAAILGRKLRHLTRMSQEHLGRAAARLEEATRNLPIIKAFNNEGAQAGRFAESLENYFRYVSRDANLRGFFVAFIIFVLFGAIVGAILFGARLTVSGQLDTREFFRFMFFSVFVGSALGGMPEMLATFFKCSGAMARTRELLEAEAEQLDEKITGSEIKSEESGDELLLVENLRFSYKKSSDGELPTLSGVNLRAKAGEKLALVGASGSGKTTTLVLLLAFYRANAGKIFLRGADADAMSLAKRRDFFAYAPQEPMLFGMSVAENLRLANPQASDKLLQESLRAANAWEFVSDLPGVLDFELEDNGRNLSAGQKQRISLARALLSDAPILLLDEALSALDAENESFILRRIADILASQGRACLMVSHRLASIRDADRIYVFRNGVIVESGAHDELMARANGVYRFMVDLQLLNI